MAMCKARLSVPEAAELMEINPQSLRKAMDNGDFPFGFGTETSTQHTYWISAYDVLKHLGYDVELKPVPKWLQVKEEVLEEAGTSTSTK